MSSVSRPLPDYAELHCLSNFSFLRGASHPEELVERAHALGYAALALTDDASLAGIVHAHVAAKACGLPLLVGAQFEVSATEPGEACTLVVLACDRAGYGNLCQCITRLRTDTPEKGRYQLDRATLDTRLGGPALVGCLVLAAPARGATAAQVQALADWLQAQFDGRSWLMVTLLRQLDDEHWLHTLREAGVRAGVPLVAAGDVHLHVRSRKPLQDVLCAIRTRRPVADCGLDLQPNAERHLRSRLRLARLYPPALLAETLQVAARCQFSLDALRYEYPEELVPPGITPSTHLRQLVDEGTRRRWPGGPEARIAGLIAHELALIAELRYEHYFLTVHDLVAFARSRGILCQGRGSAANSVVCYCLGVTEVDPQRLSTLFERFISRERNEPPDIDIDFEHERREEVIQYLYAKYGRDRAALTAAVHTYRPRGAVRDVGKALGFAPEVVDLLARDHHWGDGQRIRPEALDAAGLSPDDPAVQQWLALTAALLGFPRHLSQHSGGFVLTRGRLDRMVPIERAAMPGRTVIEWDKDDLDALGLLKVDVLALGMLTAIRKTLTLIGQRRGGPPMALQDIPAEDPATYDMVCAADTVGVFQIESRAQQSMLPRLRPRCFYDLVIEVAIVRPGPIQGGMVPPYLRRRLGQEPVTYPSEALRQALGRTLGVPIFQEQVMQVAMLAAGFSAGEADGLRRAMAAWKRQGGIERYRSRLIDGMTARGYDLAFAEAIFEQIKGFSEYGFPESHAASFALLVYASCWLKRHHPAEFLAAMLNAQPLGFYNPSQLVQDAQRHGVEVRPVDVCASAVDSTLEDLHADLPGGPCAVRLGLRQIAGLGQDTLERLVAARQTRPFTDADDLARRAALSRQDLSALAAADALLSLSGHRRQQVWQAAAQHPTPPLWRDAPVDEAPLVLPAAPEGEEVVWDYAALGLTLRRHPMAILRPRLATHRLLTHTELMAQPDRRLVRTCGIVTVRQAPGTAHGTLFLSLEDETGSVQVIVWKRLREREPVRQALLHARLLVVHGRWERSGEVGHVIAGHVADWTPLLGRLASGTSRDFQ